MSPGHVRTLAVVLAAVALAGFSRAAGEPAIRQAMMLAAEAAEATRNGDAALQLTKAAEAAALRPDVPQLLFDLAAAQAASEQTAEAIATLQQLAALGVTADPKDEPAFAPLLELPDFKAVLKQLDANARATGRGETAFAVREMTGLLEGIAWREKTGEFYFGDVNGRTIWVRAKDAGEGRNAKVRPLLPESDELLGVFGLVVDEDRGKLWAATSAVPAMRGYTTELQGAAGVAEFDLASGALQRVVLVPAGTTAHVLGDLALAPDGTVWLPDSGAPILWRLAAGGDQLEPFLEHPEFVQLQGIALLNDGQVAILADRLNGLLRVDLGSREVQLLTPPENTTVVGIDSLTVARDGSLIAIQNSVMPKRVLRLTLSAGADAIEAVTVLESAHLTMAEPAQGCLGPDNAFYFIGTAGWSRLDASGGEPTAPRAVPVFRTRL